MNFEITFLYFTTLSSFHLLEISLLLVKTKKIASKLICLLFLPLEIEKHTQRFAFIFVSI